MTCSTTVRLVCGMDDMISFASQFILLQSSLLTHINLFYKMKVLDSPYLSFSVPLYSDSSQ